MTTNVRQYFYVTLNEQTQCHRSDWRCSHIP